MKMTISQRIMALALAVCLVLTMIPGMNLVPKVEAAANQWTAIAGAQSRITADANTPSNASFSNYVTAYYDQKIDVVDGTKIAFKVNFPAITNNLLIQYAFSLVNRAGSFYTSDALASSMSLELVSTVSGSTTNPLTAGASRKPAGGNRVTYGNFASSLANPRNTTDVYDVIFEKINVTEGGVNYSWKLSVSKQGGTVYAYRYKADDVPHNTFANGAYVALGSMAGSTTHTVAVSGLTVTQPGDPAGWNAVSGAAANVIPDSTGAFNASIKNNTTAYYNNKITVAENTKISFKVNFPAITNNLLLQYSFSLVDRAKSFYTSDTLANSISLELVSTVSGSTTNPLTAGASRKPAGGNRVTYGNFASSLANPRNTTDVYDVSFKKINETVGGVNYSWLLTVANGSNSYSYKYKASDIPHTMFQNGAYLAVGTMAGSSTHTVKVTDMTVTVETPPVEPPAPPVEPPAADPAGWNPLDKNHASRVSVDAQKPTDVTLSGFVYAYYNNKITVEENTTISFKVNFPTIASGASLHYGFSLVDSAKSFHTSNTTANSLSVELQSQASPWPMNGVVSKKMAGANRAWVANLTNSLSAERNTTAVYTLTYRKINVTEAGVNYSWQITVDNGTTAQTYKVKATDIPHDLYEDGLYLAAGTMTSTTNHAVKIYDLSVKVETPPVEPPAPPVEPPAADAAGWNAVAGGAAGLVPESAGAFDASFNNYVTGYYNDKITVEENTTISFKVQFPKLSDNLLVQYAFSLVDRAGSFYTSDALANSMSLELVSTLSGSTTNPLTAGASKKMAGANRVPLNTFASALANRNTADVYDITFRKIDETEGGVNYSWMLTVAKGSSIYTYKYKASDIPHDMFANGAYLALGSMAGSTTHTVKVSDLTVKVEAAPPVVVPPVEDAAGWNAVQGVKDNLSVDAQKPENVTLTNYVTGYYNNKLTVEDGTAISFKVKFPTMDANTGLHYGFSLMDSPKSFYQSDAASAALSVEVQSNTQVENKWPVRAVISKKIAGGSMRQWMANVPNTLLEDRNTNEVYTIRLQKISGELDGVEYSWKITVTNGNQSQTMLVTASEIPHDLFKNGMYFAAGAMTSANGHTATISDLTVKKEAYQLGDPKGWNVVAGAADRLVADAAKPQDATFNKYVTGYYNEKIEVVEGTTISFDVNLPAMAAGEGLHYGFSLVDKAKSFYTSDNVANSLTVELQSLREANKKWPLNAVVSMKNTGAGRVWVANLGGSLAADRSTKTTYTITFQKINATVDNINYSWYVTITDGEITSGYGVKAVDVPHDQFAKGAYLAAGAMASATNHTMKITNTSVKVATEKFDADKLVDLSGIWKVVRGYSGIAGKGLTYKDGKVTMEGFGGIAYMKEAVKNAVSVEFELNKYDVKRGDFFSFGLVNKEGVYYNPNGQESQGIYVRIKDVNGKLSVVVYTVDKNGSVAIGELTSTTKAKGVKHYVTFFKEGGKWFVALDSKQKMRIDEKVQLTDFSHLVAGATMGKDQSMTVTKVSVDSAVTAGMKAGALKSGYKLNGFQIVRGYGVGSNTTGKGLTDKGGKTVMQGYGGIAYTGGAVKNAVAVDFEMNAYEGNSYFFSFGLLNKEGVYYNPNGQESQGIYVRIKSWQNGMGLNVTVFNLTKAGSEELGTITSKIPPKNQKHNLAIFQEDGVWYVGIDGNQKMQLNVDVNLGNTSYLCAGASGTANLTMTAGKVYIDGKVTDAMKAGAVVMSATADSQVGEGDASGGTSTEKGDGNEFVTQEGNDGPGNVVENTGNRTIVWILCGVLVCAALVAVYILVFMKKDKKEK